ncbi:hypothetical protein K0M31_016885 [Melipona bicolor]|uniref:Uncharacterized protein n=1 Tax=Melipona bicolor TaxID=60889 RepID=A0AA40FDW9_9HYME|nr:hypothetical protein K0M31_016885 [Melipona bicolor]
MDAELAEKVTLGRHERNPDPNDCRGHFCGDRLNWNATESEACATGCSEYSNYTAWSNGEPIIVTSVFEARELIIIFSSLLACRRECDH